MLPTTTQTANDVRFTTVDTAANAQSRRCYVRFGVDVQSTPSSQRNVVNGIIALFRTVGMPRRIQFDRAVEAIRTTIDD